MTKKEILNGLEGHQFLDVEFAEEICKAFEVKLPKILIYHFKGQKDANPDNHPMGLWLNEDKPVSGVWDLELAQYLCKTLVKNYKPSDKFGRGSRCRDYAEQLRKQFNLAS